jgi:hypothetical protein
MLRIGFGMSGLLWRFIPVWHGRNARANNLSPVTFPHLSLSPASLIEGVVDRGVRMTERGAVPDNGIAVERLEAQPACARAGVRLARRTGGPIARPA